ncbi:MAG TPA: HAMP domain-containing sensor histidine kinase [Candidatus Saccharimonadales bacterium]|nr:HAMP domain-containing sensor histidine kinase [Candidatus Saccharimonadales bacterium]
MIGRFLNYFRTVATAQLLLQQLVSAVVGGGLVWMYARSNPTNGAGEVILAVVAIVFIEVITTPLIVSKLIKPVSTITQAIQHVSSESGDMPPPQVNDRRSEKSGLKALVQAVYQLAVKDPLLSKRLDKMNAQQSIALPLLTRLPVAVMVFNHEDRLIFGNELSRSLFPALKDGNYTFDSLHLLFPLTAKLTDWVNNCRRDKIQEIRIWQRIGDKEPGQAGRRIFDVVALYMKNEQHGLETTLVVIDRTAEYAASDESMDFIALAAHELRGPITVIRGYLDVLANELSSKLEPDQRQLIERLDVSASQLAGYINNILNVARFDHNHLFLHLQEEDWGQLLRGYLPDLELRAHAHHRTLTLKVPADLPKVAADISSMQEVITNLVDNAIKYSREGGEIVISAYTDGDFIETTVQDFGIGIPQSVVSQLFKKFYRSHRSSSTITGTGLGLYLCKAIVESHGGSIWVRSEEGEGATFGVRLPTYASVAKRMQSEDNSNKDVIRGSHGWIKNHTYYRG